jgi:aspartate racemase
VTEARRIAGVLGGMGPEATVDFMAKVIAMTDARSDQDHVHMFVDHNPHVPNRQDAILGDGEDPGPALADMAARLETGGAEFLVMPCNTAYVFEDAILAAVTVPLISIITESVSAAAQGGAQAIGLLATDGCVRAGVYQKGIGAAGLRAVLPTDAELAAAMSLIKEIKAGDYGQETTANMARLAEALVERGADAIIAGCTEIPLVLAQSDVRVLLVSSTDALAFKTVKLATGAEPLPQGN